MKKFYKIFNEGSKVNQIICAVLTNFPVFAYGASIGWMSPMTLLLQSESSPRGSPLTDSEVSWMAAVAYITCIPGNFLMAYLGDTVGRKITLLFISATSAASWILLLSSLEVWALILARALVGITMSGCYVLCPIYTKEISEDSIRGALGCLIILFHTIGNLFLYVIGDVLRYRTILWVCLSLPTFHLVLFMMMPDSPSYLIKRGNAEEAARVLAWLRCRKEDDVLIKSEIDTMTREQKNDENKSSFLLKAILKDKILSKAFTIATAVTVAREICGAVPVLNFAGEIFAIASKNSNLVLTPNQQAMLLGVVQVVGSMLSSIIVEKAGRKPLLATTSMMSGLSMCALASWFVARDYGTTALSWLPVVTLCLCIFCDSSGLQPISIVIASEIFSFKYRGTVMAITMSVASFADFLQLLFFKPLANAVGIYVAFYFFGSIITSVICIYSKMVSPIIYSEILYDNKLENEIQYMFMPFNSMQYLFFLPKYKIYKNFISFNSFKVNVFSLIGIIIPTISFVFRTIKLLSLAYRNFYFVLFLCFDFCFYVSGFSVSYISNIVYKKENIELVLSIQRIFKMFKFKRYQNFLSCTVISWVTMYLIVIFFIIMNGLYLLLSKSYVLDTVTTFFFIYFNASVVYAGRILNIITIQLKLWISELNYLKAVNHRSHTVCKIQENYIIKSKRPNAPKKIPQTQENVIRKDWDRLLNIYRKILETYDLYKRTFQILILYHAVGTFVNTLIYVQIWIQYHNIDRVQHNPAKTRGWQISQIRICLWVVKDIIVNSFISFSSQVFYATVTKAQVECIRVLKHNQGAGAGARRGSDTRKTCKNVIRLTNVSFTVTKACGLFRVDAVYLFQMYSSIASYALVLLQFAFLK